jgi:hypothetical protein
MGNYWGIKVVSGVLNILGAIGILVGVLFFSVNSFGAAIGLGSIFGGVVLIAQAQLLGLALGLAQDVASIAEKVGSAA